MEVVIDICHFFFLTVDLLTFMQWCADVVMLVTGEITLNDLTQLDPVTRLSEFKQPLTLVSPQSYYCLDTFKIGRAHV